MPHPLTPDLSKLSNEDLNSKYGDLLRRRSMAYRWGNSDMVFQLQMLMDDYKFEIDRRSAIALEEMQKQSKQFKNIIDIQ